MAPPGGQAEELHAELNTHVLLKCTYPTQQPNWGQMRSVRKAGNTDLDRSGERRRERRPSLRSTQRSERSICSWDTPRCPPGTPRDGTVSADFKLVFYCYTYKHIKANS